MKILALDVSTKSTGWFIDKESCGMIQIDKDLEFPKKLVLFRKELNKILKEHKPKVVVMEDVHYRRGFSNIHTVKSLSKFGGVATELAASKRIKVELMTATAARKFLGLERRVTKEDVFEYFNLKFEMGWDFKKHNDITDAWMLHYAWEELERQRYREIQGLEKKSDTKEKRKQKN
jgi:Holliday junction resolvasome RuvABC endonuclease subunit